MKIIKPLPLVCFAVLIGGLSQASALECPLPQARAQVGVLKETRTTIAKRAQLLDQKGSAAVPTIIFTLRQKFPNSSNAEITNYLITAYCPVLNRKHELSDDQRRQRLEQFGDQVRDNLR